MDNIDRFRKGIHAVNGRAWTTQRGLLMDHFVYEDYGAGIRASSADEFLAWQQRSLESFPDQRLTIASIFEHDNMVCAELVAEGTHTGPLPMPDGTEVPASGRHFLLHIVTVMEYSHDHAKACRAYSNPLELMSQLRPAPTIPRQVRLDEPVTYRIS